MAADSYERDRHPNYSRNRKEFNRRCTNILIMPRFSQRSKDALMGVHPDLIKVMEAAIINSPVDFTIIQGVRTTAQQQALYAQGRGGKPGPIVTNADGLRNKSNHQVKSDGYGHAVDLYPFYNGSIQIHDKQVVPKLRLIANHIISVGKQLGVNVEWGGSWNFVDYPHFQLKS